MEGKGGTVAKLLEPLGFVDNPFGSYVAENEPEIDQYFIRPPYYDAVTERGQAARSLLLFGARGAGKSATRLTFYKNLWSNWQSKQQGPLVVTLDDYARILSDGLQKVDLGRFVGEVGYLVVEAVLVWLAALEDEDRAVYVGALTGDEEAIVIPLVQRFYLSRPQLVRNASIREPMKLLNQAWHKRSLLWAAQKWDAIVNLVGTIAQGITKNVAKLDLDVQSGLTTLLKADPKQWNDAQFAKAILVRLTDFARLFGFEGVTILVDKVDETQQTNNSAHSTAALVYPILATTQLLEIDGIGWLFFLWDKVREEYETGTLPVRLDKIAHATIQWEDTFLRNLIVKRLQFFSKDTISKFEQLCEMSVNSGDVLVDILQLAMRPPRELIRILDTIVREHDDQYAADAYSPRLVQQTIDRGLDKYAVETMIRVFSRAYIQQIKKLNMQIFINRDVQHAFKTNDQSARNRIRAWVDAGLVTQTGSRPAEGGTGGKPSHEYTVTDHRVRRMLERGLSLGADFELTDEFEGWVESDALDD
jgi:hypothetical protein